MLMLAVTGQSQFICSGWKHSWHPHYGNQREAPGASVRDGDYKLIRFFEDGHEKLYNLKEDIGETKNLAESEPEKVGKVVVKTHGVAGGD